MGNGQSLNHFRWPFLSNSALGHFWEILAQIIMQSCYQLQIGLYKRSTGSASGTAAHKAPPWWKLHRAHCRAASHGHLLCVCGRQMHSLSPGAHPLARGNTLLEIFAWALWFVVLCDSQRVKPNKVGCWVWDFSSLHSHVNDDFSLQKKNPTTKKEI